MTAMLTAPVVDLEALLEAEVPCGGNHHPYIRECDNAAQLRSLGHEGCDRPRGQVAFKCVTCWDIWYEAVAERLANCGVITCPGCQQHFLSVEAFSDYRRF